MVGGPPYVMGRRGIIRRLGTDDERVVAAYLRAAGTEDEPVMITDLPRADAGPGDGSPPGLDPSRSVTIPSGTCAP